MLKSYKFRLYPNQEQRIYLAKTLGFPKFKKKSNTNSYTTNNQNGTVHIKDNHIKLIKR